MSELALVFGMIGRLYAIARALDYDRRAWPLATRPPLLTPEWDAMMAAWYLATGRDAAAAGKLAERRTGEPERGGRGPASQRDLER